MNVDKINQIINNIEAQIRKVKSDPTLALKLEEVQEIRDEIVYLEGNTKSYGLEAKEKGTRYAERMIELSQEIDPYVKEIEELEFKKDSVQTLLSIALNNTKLEGSMNSSIESIVGSLTNLMQFSTID
jgi:hypothetical protein